MDPGAVQLEQLSYSFAVQVWLVLVITPFTLALYKGISSVSPTPLTFFSCYDLLFTLGHHILSGLPWQNC